jgi:beta-galactosidase
VSWQDSRCQAGKTVATAEAPAQTVAVDGSAAMTPQRALESGALVGGCAESLLGYRDRRIGWQGARCRACQFGVRTAVFDADKGFFLNGKSIKIQGTCNHQDHAGVGAALPDRLQWFRMAVLREMGCNAMRTSHNMPTPEWVKPATAWA